MPKHVGRGLMEYGRVADSYGSTVRVQDSSAATKRCVWIFCDPGPAFRESGKAAPHLTVAQAKRVRDALTRFIEGAQEKRA